MREILLAQDFQLNHPPHPAIQDASGELQREHCLGKWAIALTRAGLEVGALGAKSTDRGLPDPGRSVQSDQLDWVGDRRISFRREGCDHRSRSNRAFSFLVLIRHQYHSFTGRV